ncbi:ABC transporter ATP-binding protein [Flavitalea sp.]|nr:ABC transporter ATP-binding protein [Flavitalea sp.]
MNILTINGLKKTYANGVRAINDVTLEIGNGMFGLLGPNGAGKSSLMRTIAALQKPDEGSIKFNGVNIIDDPLYIRKNLGYLPQEFGVYPRISAYVLLDHIAVLKGVVDKAQRKQQVISVLEQTNLQQHQHKAVNTYSGGMRQRFGIAQALLGDPRIIIVDEPTAGLDPEERYRFNNLLSEIGEHIIVILSTHIVEDVKDLCTDMAVIADGCVLSKGHPSDLLQKLENKIWLKTINKSELARYRDNHRVISSRLNAGKLIIRVLNSGLPGEGFESVRADLEDVYFITLSDQQDKTESYV